MRSTRARCSALATALALAALPAVAQAGEEDAKTLFAAGRKHREAGDCNAAIPVFERAQKAWPEGLGALRNIAECQEELDRLASARRSWWDLRREVLASSESKYAGWAEHAEAKYAELGPTVPRLLVRLVGARAGDVRVAVDGVTIAPELVGTELERDAGVHSVEVFAGGRSIALREVSLAAGSRETVELVVDAGVVEDEPPESLPVEASPPASGMATAGYVTLGFGGLGVVGALISFAVRQSALSELEDACPDYEGGPCPDTVTAVVDRGRTASTLVNVLGAVGIAGVGIGAALLIADAVGASDETAGLWLAPLEGGAFVGVRRLF